MMEQIPDVFVKLPRVPWSEEDKRWFDPVVVRIKLSDIKRYEPYKLSANQTKAQTQPHQLTKVVYVKYMEMANDIVMLRTEHMAVDLSPDQMDKMMQDLGCASW